MTTRLSDQLLLPGGSSSLRFSEIVKKPATVLLAEGDIPPPVAAEDPITVESVRPLEYVEAAAISDLDEQRKVLPKVPLDAAGVMRTRHHAIARLLAAGYKKAEVGRVLNTSPTSIEMLMRAPAFQALLLEYMSMMDKAAIDTATKLKVLNSVGVDELTNRLLDPVEAQKLKTTEVLEIVKVASDRTGLGPTSKSVSLNGRITPADIRALKAGGLDNAQTVFEADASDWTDVSGTDSSPALGDERGNDEAAEAGGAAGEAGGSGLSTEDDLADLATSLDEILRR